MNRFFLICLSVFFQRYGLTQDIHSHERETEERPSSLATLRASVSLQQAKKIHLALLKDSKKRFRMGEAAGMCSQRSYLLSYELEKKWKLQSHRLVINCPDGDLTPFSTQAFRYEQYASHIASYVQVKSGSGIEPYVFDPQFFDQPLPLEDYLKQLSYRKDKKFILKSTIVKQDTETKGSGQESDYASGSPCFYELQEAFADGIRFNDESPSTTSTTVWKPLHIERYEKEIAEINKKALLRPTARLKSKALAKIQFLEERLSNLQGKGAAKANLDEIRYIEELLREESREAFKIEKQIRN